MTIGGVFNAYKRYDFRKSTICWGAFYDEALNMTCQNLNFSSIVDMNCISLIIGDSKNLTSMAEL